jgi:hypothetical protein
MPDFLFYLSLDHRFGHTGPDGLLNQAGPDSAIRAE